MTRRLVDTIVLVVLAAGFVLVCLLVPWPQDAPNKLSWEGFGIFVGAGLTLIMYSFLYRDNPLFKVAENLYVGVALGYGAVMLWYQALQPEIVAPLVFAPSWKARSYFLFNELRLIPIILGVLLLTRLSQRFSWLSRYSYTTMVGFGAGIGIPIYVHSYILKQLEPTIRPLGGGFWPVVGALVILVGTISVLFYFFFSIEHKRAGGAVSRVGVWFLMVSFGASFGYTVMGRLSLLIGRVRFLLFDWLKLPT